MTTGTRKTHDFCWINLVTPDSERAGTFFARLLGWTFGEMPGVPGGRLIRIGERTGVGLMDLKVCPPDTPSAIGVMIRVESADETVTKIKALGGDAEPAFDLLENGRMAMCTDPNGAHFALWQPKQQTGMDVDSHAHGAPCWFDTLTTDLDVAAEFYGGVFGWTADEQPTAESRYIVFKLGDAPVGGAMPILPRMGKVPPRWGTYFAVRDADAAARLGAELGASLSFPPRDIPGVGRFALMKSPQGVPFYVLEYARR